MGRAGHFLKGVPMHAASKILGLLATFALFVSGGALPTLAQDAPKQGKDYKPVDGMDGKDVTWVGTDLVAVNQMLDMAGVTNKDYVIDLGSGDGRMVIAAAKRGARGLGIEYNPKLVELSQRLAKKEGVTDRAEFVKADIFKSDFSKATVLMMYLLPELNRKLRPTILKLKPGTRVTSIAFDMGTWKADRTQRVKACDMADGCTAYLWIVPARVGGRWQLGDGRLSLKQRFQYVSGTYQVKGKRHKVTNGVIDGANITFRANGLTYQGKIDGKAMTGTFTPVKDKNAKATPWRAEMAVVAKRN
jgi:SAM-dependent methyltransferase